MDFGHVDIEKFVDPVTNGKKWTWHERLKLIKENFPAIDKLDWDTAFKNDIELLGWMVNDILKYDQAEQGRPGPRPALDRKKSHERFVQFMGEDYSLELFPETLKALKGSLSIRGLSSKTGLDYNHIYRLLNGKQDVDVYAMQRVAEAFNKHPSYFLEYRVMYVSQAIAERSIKWPEASISLYRKMKAAV